MIIPVILSGGSGTRLWPLSRTCHPKQLLTLHGEHSLLQHTLKRVAKIENLAKPIIVCNDVHRFTVLSQLSEIGCEAEAIIAEPIGRNTTASIALAALYSQQLDDNPMLFVLPSDHYIENEEQFCSKIASLSEETIRDHILTLGVTPTSPDPGYGYIKIGAPKANDIFQINAFAEKPSRELAQEYVQSGEYLWNSGMFLFHVNTLLDELENHAPDILACCEQSFKSNGKEQQFVELDDKRFSQCPDISFDYAVMEKTEHALVAPIDIGWSDLGNWQRLWEISNRDERNNNLIGDVLALNTKDSFIQAKDNSLVVGVGLDNHIVIQTADACLVANKDCLDDLPVVIKRLKAEKREELTTNKKMFRPWGSYENLVNGDRYQVKRIVIKPGAKLSLQLHHHRSEHWNIVKGTGKVTKDNEDFMIAENESTYIPSGVKHRLENVGKIDLELIEVQVGSYLGEDDIVRFDDVYGRGE